MTIGVKRWAIINSMKSPKQKKKKKTFTFLTATSSEADTQWGLSYPDLISLSILTIGD